MSAVAVGLSIITCLAPAPEVVRTLDSQASRPWARVELLRDSETRFRKETFVDTTAHKAFAKFGDAVIQAFGSKRPSPDLSLLHHAPAPEGRVQPVPVLLVHGVGTDSTLTWHARNIGGEAGLVPYLVERGFRVFAITFAVSHGDNIGHAVHLAHAIERVRELTGASQVDLVAHSMGGLAARAYLTRLDRKIPKARDRVRRLVTIATPHEGFDLSFRHPNTYRWFVSYGFPAPWITEDHKDVRERSIFGTAYLGHAQMTRELIRLHPLNQTEARTREVYRGRDFNGTRCPGVRAAEKRGGRFIQKLNKKALPRGLEVFLVAGTDNVVRYYDHFSQPHEQLGEYDGPSDGLIFVASALGTRVLTRRIANVKARLKVAAPHFELAYRGEVQAAIVRWLGGPAKP